MERRHPAVAGPRDLDHHEYGRPPAPGRCCPSAAPPPAQVPRTRFNAAVSAHRVVDAVTFELDDIRAMRAITPGSTVNDVVLAIVGGALRDYLSDKNELPDLSLTAMCPVSLRSETDRSPGNKVGAMFVPLHTNIGDPRARLRPCTPAPQRPRNSKTRWAPVP